MIEQERNTNVLQEDAVAILDQLSHGILFIDTQNRVLFANRAFYSLFTGTADDALALMREVCTDPETLTRLIEGAVTQAELSLHDGRTVDIEVMGLPEKRLWQFTDTTRLKQVERARQTSMEYLHAIYQHVPVGIFTLDRNGVITDIEGKRTENAMLHREDVIGMSVYDLLRAMPLPFIEEMLQKLYAGQRTDGKVELFNRIYEAHMSPVLDTDGTVASVLGVFFESTEQRRTEEALRQSEEKYHTILENIEDGYYEVDLRGNFTAVNDAFTRILGYPKEEIIGQDTRRYVRYTDETNADKVKHAFNKVYRTGVPGRVEAQAFNPQGNVRFVDISVALIRDARGEPIGFRGISRDITDRKQIEQALSQRMDMLSIMQKVDLELNQTLDVAHVLSVALNAAVLLSDAENAFVGLVRDGRIWVVRAFGLYTNVPHFSTHSGITGRVIHTQRAELILDVQSDPDYYKAIAETRAQMTSPLVSHEKLLGVLNLETADPDRFTAEVFEFVQLLTARVAAALDNAHLYELSQAQVADLRELEQLKTDIIRVASHDIRSPISVVSGYLDILHDDLAEHLRPEHDEYFSAIYSAIQRMQRMATDILSLDRVQAAKTKPETIIYMNDVLRKALMDVRDEVHLKGHALNATISDEPLPVYGSDIDLGEAIANLLNNATKYTPDGGKIEVRLRAQRDPDGEWAVVEVEDNGIGIEDDHQRRLFQPFYRVKTDKTHRIDGTGLGLYLVKKIVDFHSGRIQFHSTYGLGSTFGFQIPLAQVEAE
jgi:PAS domain S-box-containing protein